MEKQNIVLVYSIWYPECGDRCTIARPTLGLNLFIEKKGSFTPLSPIHYGCRSTHNIMCRLNKSDEYVPIWHGALMFGRNKEKLLETWDNFHRVELNSNVIDFNDDEDRFMEIIEECNNTPSPEVYYNILKVKMQGQF